MCTTRDIANRAKAAGVEASAYTVDLFKKMQELGYGEVTRKGRSVRFIAYKLEDIINVTSECEKDKEQFEVAENIVEQEQSSPPDPETITIVSDDIQKNTEILRGKGEIKTQYQPGDEVEFYPTPINVDRDDRYQGTIESIDYSNSFSATITFTCKQGKTRSITLIDASLIVGLVES